MRSAITILGTVLIIFGIIGFSYRFISYTTNEQVAKVGSVEVTAEKENVIVISPTASVLAVAAGLVLVVVGLTRKK